MTQILRIGLLTPGWPGVNTPNGIATSVYHLAMGLRDLGHEPVIFSEKTDGELPDGIRFLPIPDLPWTLSDRLTKATKGKTEAGVRHKGRQIGAAVEQAGRSAGLDAFIMEETAGWAYYTARSTRVPVVMNLHGPWANLALAFDRELTKADQARISREARAFAHAGAILAPSESSLSIARPLLKNGTPSAVIHNAFPAPAQDPTRAHRPDHILFVGRVDRLKGADTVLEAFAILGRDHANARLTFVGPDRGEFTTADGQKQSMDQALGALPDSIRSKIRFLGQQDSHEVAALRKTHKIALIASRYENLNYSLLEAMAAGQAIVCTQVGGPSEVLRPGDSALMVPPGDGPAMAAALASLLAEPDRARTLGESALAQVKQDFAPKVIAQQVVSFLRGAL